MSVDGKALRKALGQFATGVTVVSLPTEEGVHGMTANSFTSVSLEPPLVLVCVAKKNRTHKYINEHEKFAINVLAENQEAISNMYAGGDKTSNVNWLHDVASSPVLEGAIAWFDCTLAHRYDGGDHTIFVGRVEQFSASSGQPLLFHRGRYARFPGSETV